MYRFKLKEIEIGDTDTKDGKKSTVTDVNPETGAITWDIKDVADFTSTYKELEKAKDFLSKLEKTGKSKDDPAIDKLADEIQELFNTFRTHIRKNYPEEYKRVLRLKESVNESFSQEDWDIKWKLPKDNLFNATKTIDATNNRYKALQSLLKSKPEELRVFDADENHPAYDMSYDELMKWYNELTESVNEQSEQWTQLDVININKSLRLALKTFNNLVRNLERLEGELGKHSNKPQGNLLQGMAPDSFDYMGVQNKLNKLYNAFSNAFSIDESLNEGHGLDQVDLDYLQHIANKNPDDTKLEKIVKFLTKSNILVDKTKDLSKGKEVEEEKIKGADGKACWKGYRYAGTEDGKDKCVKVNEEDVEEGEGIGYLTPRAFDKNKKSTGAADIYYYKLGFKPVPKTKPKGFEVKQLFEYSDFQDGRISGFDKVEEKVNAISTLLSNAKNETVKFYNENPGSYAVVYSTDMVNELLDDIAEMLKQSK